MSLETIRSLPILKNGSRADDLKSSTINKLGKLVLTNTCTFDTIASIFVVAYCDSKKYSNEIDRISGASDFFSFISKIVKRGMTVTTYSERAEIIIKYLRPAIHLKNNRKVAVCNSTAGYIFDRLFCNSASIKEQSTCLGIPCARRIINPITFLTYYTKGDLSDLQNFIERRYFSGKKNRGYIDANDTRQETETLSVEVSDLHILVEILKWQGSYV